MKRGGVRKKEKGTSPLLLRWRFLLSVLPLCYEFVELECFSLPGPIFISNLGHSTKIKPDQVAAEREEKIRITKC